jgi:hypothetical protein
VSEIVEVLLPVLANDTAALHYQLLFWYGRAEVKPKDLLRLPGLALCILLTHINSRSYHTQILEPFRLHAACMHHMLITCSLSGRMDVSLTGS